MQTQKKRSTSGELQGTSSLVVPILPRAGLGNMMLVWAQACVFSGINSIPMLRPFWHPLRLGPLLRGERDKRYYGNTFVSGNLIQQIKASAVIRLRLVDLHYNLPIAKLEPNFPLCESTRKHIFIFNKLPLWQDYFGSIRDYQVLVKEKLIEQIDPIIYDKILSRDQPYIGIHVRLGDYKVPNSGADFSIERNTRTPLDWYVRVLEALRSELGYPVKATVFSDGYENELRPLLSLQNVEFPRNESALSDMITLSRSAVLISSSHSTFSEWASFLGQMPTIRFPDRAHLYKPTFSYKTRELVFEGGYDPKSMQFPDLLKRNLLENICCLTDKG